MYSLRYIHSFFKLLLTALFIALLPLVLVFKIVFNIISYPYYKQHETTSELEKDGISVMKENEIQEKFLPPTPKFTSKDIRDMNPRDFEVFIANIFSDNGYSTKVTQYTGDGGKDIIIKKNGITYYVECKHWESAVGRPELQKLVGAAVGSNVSDLIFISTGGFNVNAINYANSLNSNGNVHLDLWTMEDILKIANKKMKIEHRS